VRIVVDTNVVVSRHVAPGGTIAALFRHWENRALDLVVSPEILAEYERVLAEPDIQAAHRLSDEEFAIVMAGFATVALQVTPTESHNAVADDPSDNKSVECAVAGNADYVVTGDNHLLALGSYQNIQIVPPGVFVRLFATDESDEP
jgi:putative PIN family toxin of toxin-antitoxin system